MEEFSEENLPNVSMFSSSNTNERFPWLQEEEINTPRSRNENSNTVKSTKTWLNVFNKWKLQRNVRFQSVFLSETVPTVFLAKLYFLTSYIINK